MRTAAEMMFGEPKELRPVNALSDQQRNEETAIRETVLRHYPEVQGIYLFGSHGTGGERPDSDIDLALLLPHEQARREGDLSLSPCRIALEDALRRDVDLLNARRVSTVFQKEILACGRLLLRADGNAVDEFEMLTLSAYQKLNEERREIIQAALKSGRFHNV